MDFSRGNTVAMFAMSVISMIACVPVIMVFVISEEFRELEHNKVIFFIIFSNFLSNLGSSVGEPIAGSGACWFQGLLTNIFPLSSILWSVQLSRMIYGMVRNNKIAKIEYWHHLLCWSLPILLSLLPLINTTYSAPDGEGWCFLVATDKTPKWALVFWYWEAFYIPVTLGSGTMILYYLHIAERILRLNPDRNSPLWKIVRLTWVYPIIVAFTWVFALLFDTIDGSVSNSDYPGASILYLISILIPCLQGFFTGSLFWYSNKDVRKILYTFLTTGEIPNRNVIVDRNSNASRGSRGRHISALKVPDSDDPPSIFAAGRLNQVHPQPQDLLLAPPEDARNDNMIINPEGAIAFDSQEEMVVHEFAEDMGIKTPEEQHNDLPDTLAVERAPSLVTPI